jgi:hypothetical protein
MTATRRSMLGAALAAPFLGAACSAPTRLPSVPKADVARAQPLGIPNGRFFADGGAVGMQQEGELSLEREIAAWRAAGHRGPLPPANFLAISGGGDNGAFGSGLLVGWTETGNRPQFKLVTGVSTGSLISPFAFLGPEYDRQLKDVYTTITPPDIYRARNLTAALFDDAMADTGPLANVIARYADEPLLVAIAREYAKGRLLLVGTTHLDAQRPVIWNMGAIAASGHPGALALFRKILRASSAVPAAFQPVMIDVEVDGRKYQEMHVDGGAIAQLFLYPPSLRLTNTRVRRAYIIRNARLDPEWSNTEPVTLTIAGRSISTMLAASGHNDVLRTYFVTQRDRVDYNLAFIGTDLGVEHPSGEFDKTYMNALYDYGYQKARRGYPWHKAPPGIEATQMK